MGGSGATNARWRCSRSSATEDGLSPGCSATRKACCRSGAGWWTHSDIGRRGIHPAREPGQARRVCLVCVTTARWMWWQRTRFPRALRHHSTGSRTQSRQCRRWNGRSPASSSTAAPSPPPWIGRCWIKDWAHAYRLTTSCSPRCTPPSPWATSWLSAFQSRARSITGCAASVATSRSSRTGGRRTCQSACAPTPLRVASFPGPNRTRVTSFCGPQPVPDLMNGRSPSHPATLAGGTTWAEPSSSWPNWSTAPCNRGSCRRSAPTDSVSAMWRFPKRWIPPFRRYGVDQALPRRSYLDV
ncbi:hypothetical protein GA0074692_0533 [Micromonospora pallida]|uniref:Uncharacterized protein n=1 Tax=Micromonospora pallida TaxID=145854 RepID=A0A1C6RPU4_9ACTN|nr:hypothetical protein GA0074692_0533 [Micromonospora pallida]